MRILATSLAVLFLFALITVDATARPFKRRGGGDWGPDGAWGRLYDPDTVETVDGTITKITVVKSRKRGEGVHLTLRTGKETIPVHLGPAWYVEHQELTLEVGDEVEVRGSRVEYDGKPALIAAEVRRGDDVLVLRDKEGFPRWAGWRRRAQR